MAQRITLEDIARQSGVSLATVSLVLRGKPGINDDTRRRVLDVAQSLGYRRRPAQDVMGGGRLQQVGVIVRAPADDPPQTNRFYGPVLAGIEVACRRLQVNMLLATVPVDSSNQPVDLPRVLMEGATDGLLLVGAFVDATISRLLRSRPAPAVLVDGYAEENGYDSVVSDNFRGAHQAVAHLLQHGHRRVAVVASQPDSYPSIAERRRGAVQALREQGIEPIFADSPLGREPAAEAVAQLMRAAPDVTALFCCNDESAIGALEGLRGLGRDVPGDVSLVGFDDIDLAAHVVPALTTMQVDKVSMGRLAVQLLANRVEYPASGHVSLVLGPRLVERRSVRPPAGA